MRVGLLTSFLSHLGGGVAVTVRAHAEELLRSRLVEPRVFALQDPDSPAPAPVAGGPPLTLLPCSGPRKFGYSRKLVDVLLSARLDLVECHGLWMYTSYACLSWARKSTRPYVVTPHGMLNELALRRSSLKKRIALLLYQERHLRRAGLIRALSEAEADSMERLGLGVPIGVIPSGVTPPSDLVGIQQRRRSAPSRDLLYLGRLDPEKGIGELLDAWASLPSALGRKADDWRLVVCGWGDDRTAAQLRRRAAPMGDRVVFRGTVLGTDKDEALSCAAAFVLPSYREALPVAVLEAWSYGLPVVMTRFCNLPEGFMTGAALECPLEAAGLAECLSLLISMTPHEREAMGSRGRDLVQDRFSWARVTSSLAAAYTWLVSGGEPPECIRR